MNTSKKETHENFPILRVLKSASCPTLTDTSNPSYHIGTDVDEALYFKITENAGSGHYSDECAEITYPHRRYVEPNSLSFDSMLRAKQEPIVKIFMPDSAYIPP